MLVIPDEILDSITCDFCYKYLSVGPVLQYPNKKMKCGRCDSDDQNGVVCQMGKYLQPNFFVCVNRFDGCRKVMQHNVVREHEAICHTRFHLCPMCPKNQRFPTYFMIRHYKEAHRNYLLTDNTFVVDLRKEGPEYYLKRIGDKLFFVEYRKIDNHKISLNSYFLGDVMVIRSWQKFSIIHEGMQILQTSPQQICLFRNKQPQVRGVLITCSPEWSTEVVVKVEFDVRGLENAIFMKNLSYKFSFLCLPRKILMTTVNNSSSISFSPAKNSFVLHRPYGNFDVEMSCMVCNDAVPLEQADFARVIMTDRAFNAVCYLCSNYVMHKWIDQISMANITDLPELNALEVTYSCMYRFFGCKQYLFYFRLDEHERSCSFQPSRMCSVDGCNFQGKLLELEAHFYRDHPEHSIVLCRSFLEFNNASEDSVMRYHVFALYGFVSFEISPGPVEGRYKLSVLPQNRLDTITKPTSNVVVFEAEYSSTFLLSENESTSFETGTAIMISCHFDKNRSRGIIRDNDVLCFYN